MTSKELLAGLLLCATAASASPAAGTPSAADILAKTDEYRNFKGKSFEFDLDLVNEEPGRPAAAFKLRAEVLDSHRLLLVYKEPAKDRNNALLMNGNSLWFHTPDNKRPLRITPQQRLVGEAANGDVANTDYSGDYIPSLLREDTVAGGTWVLELTAKPGSMAAYKKLHLFTRKSDFAPARAEFFAPSGKLLKTARYTRFEPIAAAGGKVQMTEMEILNPMKDGKRTTLRYSNFKVASIPEAHFQPTYLTSLK